MAAQHAARQALDATLRLFRDVDRASSDSIFGEKLEHKRLPGYCDIVSEPLDIHTIECALAPVARLLAAN